MQISVYVKEEQLPELANFLSSEIPYEHSIEFSMIKQDGTISVLLFYNDFKQLQEWKI